MFPATIQPTRELVRIALGSLDHNMPVDSHDQIKESFEIAVSGFGLAQINEAFYDWMLTQSNMPVPEDIVCLIALHSGINPFTKRGVQ
jgi:hypothetical protein